jgi:hypothetical protein
MAHLVYIWLREKDGTFPAGTPYYVGKDSSGNRAYSSIGHRVHRPENDSSILVKDCFSEAEAFEMEKYLVTLFGRIDNGTGCLRNLTDGGEGVLGWNPTSETRVRMSASQRGRIHSPETRAKIGAANKGQIRSLEQCAKLRAAHKNPSLETRAKMSIAAKIRTSSPEGRAKMSIAGSHVGWNKGLSPSLETRARMSAAAKIRTSSPEWRAKQSAAAKVRASMTGWKEKMAAILKVNMSLPEYRAKLSAVHKGQISWWKGQTRSIESRTKMSAAAKSRMFSYQRRSNGTFKGKEE